MLFDPTQSFNGYEMIKKRERNADMFNLLDYLIDYTLDYIID